MVSFSRDELLFGGQDREKVVEETRIHLRGKFALELLFHCPGLKRVLAMKLLQVIQTEPLQVRNRLPNGYTVAAPDHKGGSCRWKSELPTRGLSFEGRRLERMSISDQESPAGSRLVQTEA